MSPTTFPSTSLCPGYKHVQEFGPDDEYEEGEVEYVTVALEGAEPSLISSSEHMRLIGLDTPTPFMQLSGTILKGQHDMLIGSELLFTEKKDEQDRSKRHLVYIGSTSQRLHFKEVQLRSKVASEGAAVGVDADRGNDENTTSKVSKAAGTGEGSKKARTPRKSRKDRTKELDGEGEAGETEDPNAPRPMRRSGRKNAKRKRGHDEDDADES
ncbi:hypothetical protein E1B28_003388 [Marasmius oreades]|uniref:Transcription factor TFIIIC triple barrel domain-containing protein n=1 Tax=Marasmius oreades TaxID=181124 RepID=A0A9P7RM45_9AGAR|nr:uncharacterized protein E1B28_003388 [Marasmius oreades]KAG7085852.1 hypothetical protein E1B28_003388 [Marasmius oreades]